MPISACYDCDRTYYGDRCPYCACSDTDYLHARLDALRDAIDSASRRTDRNSDEIDRQDVGLCDLSTHLTELHEAHNTLVAYAERIEKEAGELSYAALGKYQDLQQRVDRMLDRQLRMEQAQQTLEARLADREDRQIAMQRKLDEVCRLICRLNLRYDA